MSLQNTKSKFKAKLLRPADPGRGSAWAFVVLPAAASAKLPRRGRTTIEGKINGSGFTALLEPDGNKRHWLKLDKQLPDDSGTAFGDTAQFEILAVEEPEPELPGDLLKALSAAREARVTWEATTPVARLDWIHWITSAKQTKTREKRITDACEMLASGKKRVCCFDPSGFYSKAFSAPRAEDQPRSITVRDRSNQALPRDVAPAPIFGVVKYKRRLQCAESRS